MNMYHSWFYEYVLNTGWLLWSLVLLIWAGNMFGIVLVWYAMRGEPDDGDAR